MARARPHDRDDVIACRSRGGSPRRGDVHFAERGRGTPVLLLHGAGVDHRELLGTMDSAFPETPGYRRIYADLPGQGRTPAPESIRGADDVLAALFELIDDVIGGEPFLVIGHSAGGYFARAVAHRRPDQVVGLALVCPLLGSLRDVPPHAAVVQDDLDETVDVDAFRSYFVVHTPAMLESYIRHAAPGAEIADSAALERLGERWHLTPDENESRVYANPALVVVGRQDSAVGYAGQWELMDAYPRATFAMLDRAGHALPHEQPDLLGALIREWLRRVDECRLRG